MLIIFGCKITQRPNSAEILKLLKHYANITELLLSEVMSVKRSIFATMKARIKSLYILTIAVTVGMLVLQGVWLYRQYNYTLAQESEKISAKVYALLNEYRDSRSYIKTPDKDIHRHIVTSIENDSTPSMEGYSNVVIKYIEIDDEKLSDLDSVVATRLLHSSDIDDSEIQRNGGTIVKYSYHVGPEVLRTKLMDGIDDAIIEYQSPMQTAKLDSILRRADLPASISFIDTGYAGWEPIAELGDGFGAPSLSIKYPYSPLDNKTVEIVYAIPLADVLRPMLTILVASVILSILLIICLIRQITTIHGYIRLDQIRNSFVQTMIHELKRPISTLKLCVSALDNPKLISDEGKREQIVGNTRNAINNLSTYFSRLRDITFNEASQIPLNVNPYRCIDIINEAIAGVSVPGTKTVNISTECDEHMIIACDRLHISQILGNLIENAIKYSSDTVDIKVGCRKGAGMIVLEVADNGFGIPDDDKTKIFDKFYRGERAVRSSALGVGLGLAYVKLLTEAHDGTVSVESADNRGTVFTIKIPQE